MEFTPRVMGRGRGRGKGRVRGREQPFAVKKIPSVGGSGSVGMDCRGAGVEGGA